MSIDKETVAKIGRLARIRLTADEQETYAGELSGILGFVEQLSEVDTAGVEPMTSVVDMTLYLREDKVTDGKCRDDVLANAPEVAEGFFVVPKVVE